MVDFGTVTSPQKKHHWTSLVVVQWLRLHAPNAGAQVPSLVLIREDTTKKKERKERNTITFGSHFPFSPKPPNLSPAAAKSLQSCLTLHNPRDGSPPGSPAPGSPQARTLEWVAISFSNAWKWKVKVKLLSHVWLLTTPWTAAYQAPPSMGFSRQEYWIGLPLPSPLSSLKFS